MEYMNLGTLDSLLKTHGTFSEPKLADVARQVLNGLNYLHGHKIIHRDLKPSNLLVNDKMEVKIADFGVSKIMCRSLDACNSYVGTCAYMSPERFDPDTYGGNYDGYAGDIWSLGLTLLELYLGHFPFSATGSETRLGDPDVRDLLRRPPEPCRSTRRRGFEISFSVAYRRSRVRGGQWLSSWPTLLCVKIQDEFRVNGSDKFGHCFFKFFVY
ncbi:hypothetical protein SLA2020_425550 [Shorea laevis]